MIIYSCSLALFPVPMMNHHTIPKYGFGRSATGSFFLPKICNKGGKLDQDDGEGGQTTTPGNTVSLELCHGNNKQLITLPAEKLDNNKRYYVTFTLKDDELNAKRDITSLPPSIALCKGQKWTVHTLPKSQSIQMNLKYAMEKGNRPVNERRNSAFFHLTERHADFIVFVYGFLSTDQIYCARLRATWRVGYLFLHTTKKEERNLIRNIENEYEKNSITKCLYIIVCLGLHHKLKRKISEQTLFWSKNLF